MDIRQQLEELMQLVDLLFDKTILQTPQHFILLPLRNMVNEIKIQLAAEPNHECKDCNWFLKSWKYIKCRYCIQRYYGDVSNRLKYLDNWQPKEDHS